MCSVSRRLHDTSQDHRLDGLELFAALSHGIDMHITNALAKEHPIPPERIQNMYNGVTSEFHRFSCPVDPRENREP